MAVLDIVIYGLSQKLQAVKTVKFSQSQSWKKMVLWALHYPTFFAKLLPNLPNFTKFYIMLPNLPNFTKFHKILPNITKFIPNL